jgi:hypothetical protein
MAITRSSLLRLIRTLTAIIVGGLILSYAAWRSFNYLQGPHIEVYEPTNGSATASTTVFIRGKADRIINLTLNGMPMYISEDGRFGNIVIIFPGINRLTLAGYDQFERKTETSIVIVGKSERPESPIPSPITLPSPETSTSTPTTTPSRSATSTTTEI